MSMGRIFKTDVRDAPLQGAIELSPAARLERLRRLTRLLDTAVKIPGTRIRLGLDSLIGLVPAAGDLVSAALSLHILREAAKLGVSRPTLVRMATNIGIDFVGGSIPIVGDLFDVAYKANVKNMAILEKALAKSGDQV